MECKCNRESCNVPHLQIVLDKLRDKYWADHDIARRSGGSIAAVWAEHKEGLLHAKKELDAEVGYIT